MGPEQLRQLEQDGHVLLDKALPDTTLAELQRLLDVPLESGRGGVRHIEQRIPAVAALAAGPLLQALLEGTLPAPPRLVRAILFDKTPANNWLVTWHQDRTLAMARRCDREGWGPWTLKDGTWHVQPPEAVLQQMVSVRLHLDAADEHNGCLQVVPGSHRNGVLPASASLAPAAATVRVVTAPAGSALVMRPLLLHASTRSTSGRRRRVLHLEYCSHPSVFELPSA